MRFVLTDVSSCCPKAKRSLPSSSIRIGVTSGMESNKTFVVAPQCGHEA